MDNWLETKQLQVHFVSAAGIVYKGDKVLLIRTARRGWEYPGGIVEQGEAILDGLKREILEESGIIAEPEYEKERIWSAGRNNAAYNSQPGLQMQVYKRRNNTIG